ncbi:MAG TPA: DUF47 family protein [Methanospirillum sp.]|nr:DUF47 family protein [Methanospirillum sp.]
MRVRDIILPEDRIFLDLFNDLAARITEAAGLLADQVSNLSQGMGSCQKIRQLEHESDDLVRKIFERLEESLITPLEPEEIARLAKALDDVIDIIDWVSHQICNYHIKESTASLHEFSEYIMISAKEIQKGVKGVSNTDNIREIRHSARELNKIWNQSSDLLSRSVSELFEINNTLQIIKLKDIYENMEEVLQECNDVGHVLDEIVMRHS